MRAPLTLNRKLLWGLSGRGAAARRNVCNRHPALSARAEAERNEEDERARGLARIAESS